MAPLFPITKRTVSDGDHSILPSFDHELDFKNCVAREQCTNFASQIISSATSIPVTTPVQRVSVGVRRLVSSGNTPVNNISENAAPGLSPRMDTATAHYRSVAYLPVLIILPVAASLLGVYLYYRGSTCHWPFSKREAQERVSSTKARAIRHRQAWLDYSRDYETIGDGMLRSGCNDETNTRTAERCDLVRRPSIRGLRGLRSRALRRKADSQRIREMDPEDVSGEMSVLNVDSDSITAGPICQDLEIMVQTYNSSQDPPPNSSFQALPMIIVTPASPLPDCPSFFDSEGFNHSPYDSHFFADPESDEELEVRAVYKFRFIFEVIANRECRSYVEQIH